MAKLSDNQNDFSPREILDLLDFMLLKARPLDIRYAEELRNLVKDVTVDLYQILPDDEMRSYKSEEAVNTIYAAMRANCTHN